MNRKSNKYKAGSRKVALIILVSVIAIGLLLPSFMSLLWGLGQ